MDTRRGGPKIDGRGVGRACAAGEVTVFWRYAVDEAMGWMLGEWWRPDGKPVLVVVGAAALFAFAGRVAAGW